MAHLARIDALCREDIDERNLRVRVLDRYRVFEATDVVDLFTGLERALASPTGDTATAAPNRQVPHRVKRAGDEA
ncbi:MAG: hypothetical protein ACKVWR_12520 [Acidimicrobiales bacterium]